MAVFGILVLLTFVVFGNTFWNGWTYDDVPVVLQNPDVQSLSSFLENSYPGRPLRELSYMLDYRLFGENPAGYHIQQNLWHAANGFLLYCLLGVLGVGSVPALLGVLLFLFHPLQVESVASIGHRKELLPLFFGLLSILCYIKSLALSGSRRFGLWLLCGCCYGLAVLGNVTVATLPLLFPVYEYLYLSRERRVLLKYPLLFWGALTAAVVAAGCYYGLSYDFKQALATLYAQNGFGGGGHYYPLLFVAFKAYALYLGKLVWPVGLAPEYALGFSRDYLQWGSVAGMALFGATGWLLLRLRRSSPGAALGIAWVLVLYLPVSNLLPVYAYIMADRYMYLVLPGVAMAVAVLLEHFRSRAFNVLVVALLVILSALTVVQNGHWRNNLSLWSHAVRVNPDSTGANWSAAQSFGRTGDLERAKSHYLKVLDHNRFFAHAYLEIAKLEERMGNRTQAIEYYEKFVRYGRQQFPQEASRISSYLRLLSTDDRRR